jgi:hypothetical protein
MTTLAPRAELADLAPGAGPQRRVVLSELLERSDFVMPLSDGATATALRPRLKPGAALVDYRNR